VNAVPARWPWADQDDTEDMKPIGWHPGASGIYFECEIVQPPSSKGRRVTVHIRDDEVLWLMKELKDVSIARRSKPMEGAKT
jgi:hypothetical protein